MISQLKPLPLVIIGGGGHASVLVDILLLQNREIVGIISPEATSDRQAFADIPKLSRNSDVENFDPTEVLLVNGIGMTPKSNLRMKLSEYYSALGYRFETVICESAYVSRLSQINEGAQVLSNSTVQTGAKIESQTIINSGAIVEHDCHVGKYCHIAPNAVICGQVKLGSSVFVGAGATIIQNCEIVDGSIIGAGACITSSAEVVATWFAPLTTFKPK